MGSNLSHFNLYFSAEGPEGIIDLIPEDIINMIVDLIKTIDFEKVFLVFLSLCFYTYKLDHLIIIHLKRL